MSLDHDKIKKRRAGSRGGFGWKPKDGQNTIRVLPPHSRFLTAWEEMEDIAVTYKMHYFKIEGRPTEVTRCLEDLKQRCPACDAWRAHRKSDDPGLKELAREVSPADAYLLNILDVGDLQRGIQQWSANYTCWDGIMEIVANPQWGNVLEPANGVNFVINLVPKGKSRTGFNKYSVTPEPQRTDFTKVLEAIPDWQEQLDHLDEMITEAKEPEEIRGLVEEMGFPPPSSPPGRGAPVAPPPTPAPTSPAPASAPAPQAAQPVPAPQEAQPVTPPQAQAAAPAPTPAPTSGAAAPAASGSAPSGVHYDPGPQYTPVVPDGERPGGAPRCFGDYRPEVHRCQPCPVMADCQMRHMGIA